MLTALNARFRDIFTALEIKTMGEMSYVHINNYLDGEVHHDHSSQQRQTFVTYYRSFVFNVTKWIKSKLSIEEQSYFSKYTLPDFPFDNRDYDARKNAIESAQKTRKDETSAVAPLLPRIRAQVHFRYNPNKTSTRDYKQTNNRCEKQL
ncbi:hypothetical protein ACFC0X_07180 [Paenibacillus chitinolyticus]|uniref:hypothetical protein n=1 Tax=Paenibacillus chitinolyticus TaxID=79263 RepID=UPI0035E294F7